MHEMHKEEEVTKPNWKESNKSFDSVSMNSLVFHSMKLVLFTKLELSTSQKGVNLAYKIDTGSNGK